MKEEYNDFVTQISKELFIDLTHCEYEKIITIISQVNELRCFINNRNYLKKELINQLKIEQNKILETNDYFNKNFDKEILNYISKIDYSNFIEKLDNILRLEEINIQRNIISERFQELTYLEKNVTELNKEILDLQ